MFSGSALGVFDKYKSATSHAFSENLVSEEDKDVYQNIYQTLLNIVREALLNENYSSWYDSWEVRFGRDGGVQGHRPVDLWASVINKPEDSFNRFPQTYIIATAAGLEIGFTVAIHESDYFNPAVKQRNREVIPLLYKKLPPAEDSLIQDISNKLLEDGDWLYGLKSRQGLKGDFSSFSELVSFLKSPAASVEGGGSIYKIIPTSKIDDPNFNPYEAFNVALSRFSPLMRVLTPSAPERVRLKEIGIIHDVADKIPDFDPSDTEDGRRKILSLVAIRQGQAKFREKLIDAYKGRCAVSGTPILATLQAAHIIPYNGPDTNVVSNGILLRADIHNLFDIGFLHISPDDYTISVSEEVMASKFAKLQGKKIRLPKSDAKKPNKEYLRKRLEMFKG